MGIKGQISYINCITCGSKTRTFKSRLKKFCSRKCYAKSLYGNIKGFTSEKMKGNKFRKGIKPWNYIDGRSRNQMWERYGINWKKIRKNILERDNNQCQICGKFEGRLEIHHKIPFMMSKDNSFSNLVTLCSKCHRFIDNNLLKNIQLRFERGGIWQQQSQIRQMSIT